MFTPHELRGSAVAGATTAPPFDSRRGACDADTSATGSGTARNGPRRPGPGRVLGRCRSGLALRGDGDNHDGRAGGALGATIRAQIVFALRHLDAAGVLHLRYFGRNLNRAAEQRSPVFLESRVASDPSCRRAGAGRTGPSSSGAGAGVPRATGRSGPLPARTGAVQPGSGAATPTGPCVATSTSSEATTDQHPVVAGHSPAIDPATARHHRLNLLPPFHPPSQEKE